MKKKKKHDFTHYFHTHLPMTHWHQLSRYLAPGMPDQSEREGHAELLPAFDAPHRHLHREGVTVQLGLEGVPLWHHFV